MNTAEATAQVEGRVKGIVVEVLDVEKEQVTREAKFFIDLPMDSLDMIEIAMEIEDAFDLSIPQEDVDNIRTVGDAIDYVIAHT